jgi:hypothetical protein
LSSSVTLSIPDTTAWNSSAPSHICRAAVYGGDKLEQLMVELKRMMGITREKRKRVLAGLDNK